MRTQKNLRGKHRRIQPRALTPGYIALPGVFLESDIVNEQATRRYELLEVGQMMTNGDEKGTSKSSDVLVEGEFRLILDRSSGGE